MKICGISDIHGDYNKLTIEPCDILFICGDIVPLYFQRNIPRSFMWFENEFIPWCKEQPVDQIYMVGGNHDFFLENHEVQVKKLLMGTNITILYNEGAEYISDNGKIYKIWGSPLCHIFGNWAFMRTDEYNKERFNLMPNDVDFLITHDAAYGNSDQCLGFSYEKERELHRGNRALKEIIENKHPKYHLFGHLHTCNHNLKDYDGTQTVCVSLLDEGYYRIYEPFYLEIDE